MNTLEAALQAHDWSLAGYAARPALDQLIKEHTDSSAQLWEQYCPWSATNGGYIAWAAK